MGERQGPDGERFLGSAGASLRRELMGRECDIYCVARSTQRLDVLHFVAFTSGNTSEPPGPRLEPYRFMEPGERVRLDVSHSVSFLLICPGSGHGSNDDAVSGPVASLRAFSGSFCLIVAHVLLAWERCHLWRNSREAQAR